MRVRPYRKSTLAAITLLGLALCVPSAIDAQERKPTSGQSQPAQQSPNVSPAEELRIPESDVWLGTVRIPRAVLADGKKLPPGRYRVRLTSKTAANNAVGQTERLERWVEFVQNGDVKGRELAPIVPAPSVPQVAEQRPPRPGGVKVQALKPEDKLVRLWFNERGDQVLIYLPYAQ